MRYEVLTAANENVTIFWHTIPHSLVDQCFTASITLKTEAADSSDMSASTYHPSQMTIIINGGLPALNARASTVEIMLVQMRWLS